MDLSVMQQTSKDLGRTLSKNSPTILTGLGVAGLLTTIVLAVKATPEALKILEREHEFRYDEGEAEHLDTPIDVLDTIELTWKCYIPTTLMALTTIGCMIGANSIHLRRTAALVSLFSITETALKEYQAKVVERIGENKEATIRGELAQDKVKASPVKNEAIILTNKGNYLCFDSFSGRYFRSDVEAIRRCENLFNQKLLREGWLSINEFYYELGLDNIELGESLGWIAQYAILDIKYNVALAKDDEPCLVMEYRVQPKQI